MTPLTTVTAQRRRIEVSVPDTLYRWLSRESKQRGATMDQLLSQALELYAQTVSAPFDITRTHTWELCGALNVAEVEPEYVVTHGENGGAVTNYAEHADDVLYRTP
jgi:hypothetical protein